MHPSVAQFVAETVTSFDLTNKTVLDVGSRNINGTSRPFFRGAYWGVDMLPGPGVDQILNAHQLERLEPDLFDVIVCTEMLEHDSEPWTSVAQMHRVCMPGGFLLLTARGYDERGCFPVHGYPEDFWRFSVNGMEQLLKSQGWHVLDAHRDPEQPGVFAIARFQ